MVLKATPSDLNSQPVVEFRKDDYNAAIWVKGYPIIIEKAVRCPCEGKTGLPLGSCQNCHGTGYFYINPIETIGLISGVNRDTKYKEWSAELIGTISLTVRDYGDNNQEKVSFYDRVTLTKRSSSQPDVFGYHSEVIDVRENSTGGKFVFLAYKPIEILDVFYFVDSTSNLVRVNDFSINESNPYALDIDISSLPQNGVVSVRYKHIISYHVIDIPHEIRHSVVKNKMGGLETVILPINVICRRSHLTQIRSDYDGTGVRDNSYL